MRIATLAFATVLTGLTLAAQGGFTGAGLYEIRNVKSGKVLDLDRNDQTTVIQFSSRNTDNQTWEARPADNGFFYLINAMNGNALDAGRGGRSDWVRGVPYNGAQSQMWRFEQGKDGNVLIVSRLNGRALDVPDGSDRDGQKVQMYDANGDSNQRFAVRAVQGRAYGQYNNGRYNNGQYNNGQYNNGQYNNGQYPANTQGGGFNWGQGNPSNNNQANQQQQQTVVCSSNDGNRAYCNADTRGGVALTRQLSGSACQQGQTWGYDNNGIWVDRGCRAEFTLNQNNSFRRNRYNRSNYQTTVVCASNNGQRVYCDADTRRGVDMIRSLSGSQCTQGDTWGYDNRGVWVDRGCRAEFGIGYINQ